MIKKVKFENNPYIDQEFNEINKTLLENRIIFINTDINDDTAEKIITSLLYLDSKNHTDISIYINSAGGIVTSGLAIYDTMQYILSNIKIVCLGQACSMAAILLSSGTRGKRFSLPNSRIMIHQPWGLAEGKASDIKISSDEIQYLKRQLNKILAENIGKSIEEIEDIVNKGDTWLNPKQAIKMGLIDGILTKKEKDL